MSDFRGPQLEGQLPRSSFTNNPMMSPAEATERTTRRESTRLSLNNPALPSAAQFSLGDPALPPALRLAMRNLGLEDVRKDEVGTAALRPSMHNEGFEDEVGTAAGSAHDTPAPVILDNTNSFTTDEVEDLFSTGKFVSVSESIFGLTIFMVLVQWDLPRIAQSFTRSDFGYKEANQPNGFGTFSFSLIRVIMLAETAMPRLRPQDNVGNDGNDGNDLMNAYMHLPTVTLPLFSMCMIVALTQGALMWYIWKSLSAIGDSPFCQNFTLLHMMVTAVVIVQFLNQCGDVLNDLLCLEARYFIATKDKDKNGRVFANPAKKLKEIDFMVVITYFQEILLIVFAVVGIRYMLQQDGASNLVQACVALQFILDIDNYVYQLLLTDSMKEVIRSVKFSTRRCSGEMAMSEVDELPFGVVSVPPLLFYYATKSIRGRNNDRIRRRNSDSIQNTVGFVLLNFSSFVLIVVISLAIVLGLRTTYCPVVVNQQGVS